jgi:CelD/BcsL family acetyltransferase involved in cellulose biosynthesis
MNTLSLERRWSISSVDSIAPMGVSEGRRVRVVHGFGLFDELGESFDVLARVCRAPVTARRPWLESWIRRYRHYHPVAVEVLGPGQTLAAVALLGARRRRFGTEVVALGHGASDQSRVYATDAAASRDLALAVRSWLGSIPLPWRMTLAQLPADDVAVAALRDVLPHHLLLPAPGSPMVIFDGDRRPGRYISANQRGQANNKWNRMVKHGLQPELRVLTAAQDIAPVLPRVIEIACIRQEELTGTRKLDQPHHAGFFKDVVLRHAERGEVELMLVEVGGEIGAYLLTFLDGRVARMWSSHYHPRWSDYSLGHVLCRELVERCVRSPAIDVLDWMKGLEPYKFRTANHVEAAQSLRAWSGISGRSAGEVSRWVRTALSGTTKRYPVLRRLQIAVRRGIGRIAESLDIEKGEG